MFKLNDFVTCKNPDSDFFGFTFQVKIVWNVNPAGYGLEYVFGEENQKLHKQYLLGGIMFFQEDEVKLCPNSR